VAEQKSKMTPFGKALEKATESVAQREHAEDYYKKEAAKVKEIDSAPGKKSGGKVTKKWIQSAIKKPGALRAQLGAKEGKPISPKKLAAAATKPGKLGQRARLAQTLKKLGKK